MILCGTYDKSWGHTWLCAPGSLVYALKSRPDKSILCVFERSSSGEEKILTQNDIRKLGEIAFDGRHSCHISRLERQLVVSDYSSGTLTLFDIDESGMPQECPETIQFEGHSVIKGRQDSSHIHSSSISSDNKYLLVSDLGCDKLYRFRITGGKVDTDSFETFSAPEGSGPRISAYSKDGRFLFVATELSDELLTYDAGSMALTGRSVANPAGTGGGAHVDISPDGAFVYVSSRGENSGIAVFRVDKDGILESCGYVLTSAGPRHFVISEDGFRLVAACKEGNCLEVYTRNRQSGLLLREDSVSVPAPVWVGIL